MWTVWVCICCVRGGGGHACIRGLVAGHVCIGRVNMCGLVRVGAILVTVN